MSVGKFCNRQVVIAGCDRDIVAVAKLMRQYHVGTVVIVKEEEATPRIPVGIITDRDIVVELLAMEIALDSVTVGDAMSYQLATAHEADSIGDTLQTMRSKGIRRMVVVDDNGGLAGILTTDDLLELFAEELTSLATITIGQQSRERQIRD
ncbi:MAG: CBS domain-containing protein [Desulfobulbaceae bacterium]|nr:CBS domain-containing protein [Desulfobulbaceae bacterium]